MTLISTPRLTRRCYQPGGTAWPSAIGLIAALHGLASLKINKPLYPWPLARLIDQATAHSLHPLNGDDTSEPPAPAKRRDDR